MEKLENEAKKFLTERGWDKLKPSDLAKSISIESGELLEVFQWSNEDLEKVKSDTEKLPEIKKELADVILYALYLSVLLGLDTEKIVLDKLEMAKEKYPTTLFKRGNETEPGTEHVYKEVKKLYRRNGKS